MQTELARSQVRIGIRAFGLTVLVLAAAGCNPSQGHLAKFNHLYERGDLADAAEYAQKRIKPDSNPSGNDLLWALQLGAVARSRGQFAQSNEWFDQAEEMMNDYDTRFRGLDAVSTTVVNETALPYRGEAYDGIMVNTYKALNFMAMGNDAYARVEFNRALERQMRARERFNQEIQKVKQSIENDENNKNVDYNKTIENPDLQSRIAQKYPSLYDFQAYPDFVNPFSTYIAGVFFTMIGDSSRAIDLLKESAGMVPENATVAKDFELVDSWLDTGRAPEPSVWVVYEAGLGPMKEEFRIDLPLIYVTDKVYYAGIALPMLAPRSRAAEYAEVESNGSRVHTEVVAEMDRVIQTEFSKDFPGVLTRAVIAAAAKVIAQNALLDNKDTGSMMAGLVLAAYTAATTVADVRIWSSLPKQFQVARVPMPAEGTLRILVGGNHIEVPIGECRYALVYIRMISRGGEPIWQVTTRGRAISGDN